MVNFRLIQLIQAVRNALTKSFGIAPTDDDVVQFMQNLNEESATVALLVHEHDHDHDEEEHHIH